MRRVLFVLSLMIALTSLLLTNAGANEKPIFRVSDSTPLDFSDMIKEVEKASLVFVGESHNNKSHHQLQLQVIEALEKTDKPVAVGLEMFQKESQQALDQWIKGELSEEAFQKIYYENWNFPWSFYRDIFIFARDHKIPMIGLNVSREITKKVAQKGFASLTAEERGKLPMVTCRVDSAYMEFIQRAYGSHGHHGGKFSHFCEAQLVWDTAMAFNLLQFLKKNPQYTVVVLAGTGHSWKPGIPEQVELQSKGITYQVILPEIQDRLNPQNISIKDADYLGLISP